MLKKSLAILTLVCLILSSQIAFAESKNFSFIYYISELYFPTDCSENFYASISMNEWVYGVNIDYLNSYFEQMTYIKNFSINTSNNTITIIITLLDDTTYSYTLSTYTATQYYSKKEWTAIDSTEFLSIIPP